jgi:hypothetical protein
MRYDSHNDEHYPSTSTTATPCPATYIRYVFDGEDTILEGTDGKLYPIYRKALHSRPHSGKPNTSNDKLIRDDHLFVMDPESDLRELVDRAVHAQKDPGLTADVVRFRAQKNREATLAARLKSLEEDIRLNHDALSLTRRHLIHARAATRIFNAVYETPAPEAPTHRAYFIPKLRGAQGPADTLRRAHTPPEDAKTAGSPHTDAPRSLPLNSVTSASRYPPTIAPSTAQTTGTVSFAPVTSTSR